MKKLNIFFLAIIFLAGSMFAQTTVDVTGHDSEWHYYVHNSLGPRIAVDDAGDVHVVYNKSYVEGTDTAFALMYANVTQGTKDTIRPQAPTMDIKPSRAFIGGGRGTAPLFICYGISTYNFTWGDMPLQAMNKVDEAGKVIPLGEQPDKNYYHQPYYALPISMEVSSNGIAHVIGTNVGGDAVYYWNFDGTNFGEISQMYFSDAANDVPGKNVPGKYRRNATKGADLAITSDGSEVAVGGLHPWSNIDVTYGAFGGELWPDDMEIALDAGEFIFLFDTTNCATGDNLPHDAAKPATDLQLAYDDDGVLHVVYQAEWFSHHLDTLSDAGMKARNGGVDKWNGWSWMTTYYHMAGDTNAVYYGTGKPKPQIRYWNSTMPTMATSINSHTKITESVYPMAGEEYKWWTEGVIDSGIALWGNRANSIIEEVDLIINTGAVDGEPKAVVIWEEMMSEPTDEGRRSIVVDGYNESYIGYYRDIQVSVTTDLVNWSPAVNLTNTPAVDEGEVSVFTDVIDGKAHFVYNVDDLPMSDYFLRWSPLHEDKYLSGPTMRVDQNVDIMYMELDVNALIVGVKEDAVLPGKFELAQNYPNPFNPSTTIAYSIPARSDVNIKVYNNLGQLVATLFNGVNEAGTHEVSWNAASVSTGIYFYSINAGDFTSTKKMILLK